MAYATPTPQRRPAPVTGMMGAAPRPAAASVAPMPGNPSVLTAAPQPAAAPAVAAARPTPPPVTQFGPGNDLRFAQVNPVAGQQATEAQQMAHQSAQQLSQVPDREALATSMYDRMLARSSEKIGKDAAAYGRLGSGMTAGAIDRESARIRADLADQAAGQHMADYLARQGALQGYAGQTFGRDQSMRDELRGERGYQYGVGRDALNDRLVRSQLLGEQAGQQGGAAQDLIAQLAMQEWQKRQAAQPARG